MTKYGILGGIIGLLYVMPLFSQEIKNKAYDVMLQTLLPKDAPTIGVKKVAAQEENALLLDARSLREYEVSHMKDAQWIGFEEFSKDKVKDIPKDTNIIVYCSVGYRSGIVAKKLIDLGFKNVNNLYGGIFEWKNQGHEVFVDNQPTDSVHAYSRRWGIWLQKGNKVYDEGM